MEPQIQPVYPTMFEPDIYYVFRIHSQRLIVVQPHDVPAPDASERLAFGIVTTWGIEGAVWFAKANAKLLGYSVEYRGMEAKTK